MKNHDVVDAPQRGDELGPVLARQDWPSLPLQRPHRLVVIDRHDQAIGFGRGGLEIADMAHVQQVEAPVGKGHAPTGRAICRDPRRQLGAPENLTHGRLC